MSDKQHGERTKADGDRMVGQGRVLAKISRDNPTLSKSDKLKAGKAAADRLLRGTMLKNQTTDDAN